MIQDYESKTHFRRNFDDSTAILPFFFLGIKMYTIADLEESIDKIHKLKHFLEKTKYYNHGTWFKDHTCGTPSCALGHAAIFFRDEFINVNFVDHPQVILLAAKKVFKFSISITQYLFYFGVISEKKLSNNRYLSSDDYRCDSKLKRMNDSSLETTLKRINIVENYLRRKLATLLAEQESRKLHRKNLSSVKAEYVYY